MRCLVRGTLALLDKVGSGKGQPRVICNAGCREAGTIVQRMGYGKYCRGCVMQ